MERDLIGKCAKLLAANGCQQFHLGKNIALYRVRFTAFAYGYQVYLVILICLMFPDKIDFEPTSSYSLKLQFYLQCFCYITSRCTKIRNRPITLNYDIS